MFKRKEKFLTVMVEKDQSRYKTKRLSCYVWDVENLVQFQSTLSSRKVKKICLLLL